MKMVTIEYQDPRGSRLVSREHLVLDGTEQAIIKTNKMLSQAAVHRIQKRIQSFMQGRFSVLILEDDMEITFIKRSFVMTDEEEMNYHIEEIGWDAVAIQFARAQVGIRAFGGGGNLLVETQHIHRDAGTANAQAERL